MVAGGKKVSGCEIKIWLDYAICGGEKSFECFIPKCFEKEKTHLKRGGWDSCWVWVSVSMSSRRHGWVLDKSHVIPSSEQLKEFYFHHLDFWSWQQCAELGIKCQFWALRCAMPGPCTSALPADTMLWSLFAWHLIAARLSFGYLASRGDITGLFSDIITLSERLKWPLPPPSWPTVQQTLRAESQSLW